MTSEYDCWRGAKVLHIFLNPHTYLSSRWLRHRTALQFDRWLAISFAAENNPRPYVPNTIRHHELSRISRPHTLIDRGIISTFHYFRPRREPSGFPVVAVLAEPHFWPDQQNPPIQEGYPAVVRYILVHHRHTHVYQHIVANTGFQNGR